MNLHAYRAQPRDIGFPDLDQDEWTDAYTAERDGVRAVLDAAIAALRAQGTDLARDTAGTLTDMLPARGTALDDEAMDAWREREAT